MPEEYVVARRQPQQLRRHAAAIAATSSTGGSPKRSPRPGYWTAISDTPGGTAADHAPKAIPEPPEWGKHTTRTPSGSPVVIDRTHPRSRIRLILFALLAGRRSVRTMFSTRRGFARPATDVGKRSGAVDRGTDDAKGQDSKDRRHPPSSRVAAGPRPGRTERTRGSTRTSAPPRSTPRPTADRERDHA
ncbi:hypothetical protein GCM10020256_16340 [Streptomyces thermocoprophilus]